jgi:hypothetical protein
VTATDTLDDGRRPLGRRLPAATGPRPPPGWGRWPATWPRRCWPVAPTAAPRSGWCCWRSAPHRPARRRGRGRAAGRRVDRTASVGPVGGALAGPRPRRPHGPGGVVRRLRHRPGRGRDPARPPAAAAGRRADRAGRAVRSVADRRPEQPARRHRRRRAALATTREGWDAVSYGLAGTAGLAAVTTPLAAVLALAAAPLAAAAVTLTLPRARQPRSSPAPGADRARRPAGHRRPRLAPPGRRGQHAGGAQHRRAPRGRGGVRRRAQRPPGSRGGACRRVRPGQPRRLPAGHRRATARRAGAPDRPACGDHGGGARAVRHRPDLPARRGGLRPGRREQRAVVHRHPRRPLAVLSRRGPARRCSCPWPG